jgi:hypothetical protein
VGVMWVGSSERNVGCLGRSVRIIRRNKAIAASAEFNRSGSE